jgi:hypothetical protein
MSANTKRPRDEDSTTSKYFDDSHVHPNLKKPFREAQLVPMDKNDIDEATCALFRAKAMEALQKVAKELGLNPKVDLGGIRYDKNQLKTSITCYANVKNTDGETKTIDQINWDKKCAKFGLSKEDWGKEVVLGGHTVKLITIEPQAKSKVTILLNGQRRICNAGAVILALRKSE